MLWIRLTECSGNRIERVVMSGATGMRCGKAEGFVSGGGWFAMTGMTSLTGVSGITRGGIGRRDGRWLGMSLWRVHHWRFRCLFSAGVSDVTLRIVLRILQNTLHRHSSGSRGTSFGEEIVNMLERILQ